MKTWKDIKEGDIIYYWDHGRLHAQKVHSVAVNEVSKEYMPTYNIYHEFSKNVVTYTEHTIKAGKGTTIKWRGEWLSNQKSTRISGMRRFSCIEAAQAYIKSMVNQLDEKRQKLTSKLNQVNKQLTDYSNNLQTINDYFML